MTYIVWFNLIIFRAKLLLYFIAKEKKQSTKFNKNYWVRKFYKNPNWSFSLSFPNVFRDLAIYFKSQPCLGLYLITQKSHSNPLYSHTVLKKETKPQHMLMHYVKTFLDRIQLHASLKCSVNVFSGVLKVLQYQTAKKVVLHHTIRDLKRKESCALWETIS